MLKILGIITKYIIMSEESISQEVNLKNKEINRNESMSKKRKKVCRVLNYIEHWFIFISSVTGCVFISAFASLVDTFVGIANSAVGLNICVITAGN